MANKYIKTKIACYTGFVVQAIINNFLPILFIVFQDVYGLGYERLARLIVVNFLAQMVVDLISPKIMRFLGCRASAFLSQATAALGLILMGTLPKMLTNTYLAINISIIVYAIGSGLMEVLLSPIIERLPSDNKSGSMSILHSFYCWGQAFTIIVTTALVAVFGFTLWNYIPLLWAIVPFFNSIAFLRVPLVNPEPDRKLASLKQLLSRGRFRLYMLLMLCAGAAEIAAAQWTSIFAQKGLGVTKAVGDLAGPCAFALFMGLGRLLYGLFSDRISFKKAILILSSFSAICYLGIAVSGNAVISLLFCALCGFSVSIFWPAVLSAGADDIPDGGMVMYSVFAMCGDIGCSIGPWILGIVADYLGLKIGFGVCALFPLIMFISTALMSNKNNT